MSGSVADRTSHGWEYGARRAAQDGAALVMPSLITWILSVVTICVGVGMLEAFPSLAKSGAQEDRSVLSRPSHCSDDRVVTKFARIMGWMGIICGCCMLLVLSAAIPFRMIACPLSLEIVQSKRE